MTARWFNRRDLGAGVFCICCGAAALGFGPASASERAMDPRLFPAIAAYTLCASGLLVAMSASRTADQSFDLCPGACRASMVIVATVSFGLLVRPFGLSVATCALVALSSVARPGTRARDVAVLAAGLAALGALVFRVLLGLPLDW
jgi:Tripartite tricarboxylate transporter TctB family